MKFTDKAAYDAAADGIVLLKNERNIFPLTDEVNKVLITGTGSENLVTCGEGSAGVVTDRNTSFSYELAQIMGENRVSVNPSVTGRVKGEGEIIIVVASLPGMEGNDRINMKLDSRDRAVLRELALEKQSGKDFRIVLILNVCGPVSLSEYEPYVDGIFCMFLPGMQGGKAMADIITGRVNPSGKLPVTFPVHYRDTPTYINFPGDGYEVNYGEGIFVGYRYYEKKKIKPAYAFGYGLSYTSFEISGVRTSAERFSDKLTVSGRIKNTGEYAGAQVVQIYITDVFSTCPKPAKELKKFKKIFLNPGESKKFEFVLDENDFSYFDSDYGRFLCEEGYFDIVVATSSTSDDVAAIRRVYREGTSPYSFGLNSTVKVFFENPALKELLLKFWISENFDTGLLESCYRYTPGRKLYEILPKIVDSDTDTNQRLERFLEDVSRIEKR
ncbi:MAG: glycoside hydrolase family 3 C-terminal domain-containing protein [Oscillospiraceae bacterium]|nr:glycoside hydrolase family 3 C-terminal domain-containing protein [Oscillospiraceae bacterium]